MIHYNNDNNAYCSAVNAQKFETREHKTISISTFLDTRNLCSYSHLEIFICMYSVRGEIHQITTNTFRYTTCCAANVYMFVCILIGAHIVPLKSRLIIEEHRHVMYNRGLKFAIKWSILSHSL